MRNFINNCSNLERDALALVESRHGFLLKGMSNLDTGLMQAVTSIVWKTANRLPAEWNNVCPFVDENKKDP